MKDTILKALEICFDKSPADAVNYLKSQGVEVSWNWEQQLNLIKQHVFTVAKTSNADILQMFKDELVKSLEDGIPFEEFKKEVNTILKNKGWTQRDDGSAYRLDTIYRTNLQNSYMSGKVKAMKEAQDTHPFWRYDAIMDSRVRPSHAALNGKIFRSDDPFWNTRTPPLSFNCRCTITALSNTYVDNNNLDISNGSDFKSIKADSGFEKPPGENNWNPDTSKYSPDIRNELLQLIK